MFKPNAGAVRAISRTILRPQILNAARRLHGQAAQGGSRTNVLGLALTAAGGVGAIAAYQAMGMGKEVQAEVIVPRAKINLEDTSKNKISAQHIQVTSSLENPGVYVWGDNTGKVVDPLLGDKVIKTPRRFSFFDGVLLRDLQLSQDAGVAVDANGDILQWGTGYSNGITTPEMTLKGKGIDKVVLSKDKIIALSKSGKIYGFPISKQAQHTGGKPTESSWVPGMSSSSAISYRHLEPSLSYSEKVTDIAAGRDHILILTSKGRVFSSAAASTYPNRGQMGIPGLIYSTRPADKPYDTAHEITALQGHTIKQIAAGDFHSVVLDDKGQVYTFGDNIHGQLGFEYHPETNIVDVPTPLPLSTIYPKGVEPKAAKIAAGGMNSYFIVDVNEAGRSSVDVLSCGTGIHGNLGNGRWKHIQGTPEKIKALSGLFEYNETIQKTQPIRLRDLSVGATHAAAVVANNTNIKAAGTSSSDVNYGADVLWWGNNEHYQLGTGKRNNASVPVYIQPLDGVPAGLENSKFTGSSSRGAISDRHSRIIGGVGNENSGIGAMGPPQVHRFQATPPGKVKGNGNAEQTVVCGRGNTAVYMKKV